jgi:hypothetical protein
MLHEISKDEYERGKENIIRKLFDMYENNIIDDEVLKNKMNILNDEKEETRS